MAVRVRIAEQATQQHLIRAGANAGHHVRWLKCSLLDLGEKVFRVAVEHQSSYSNRCIVTVGPDFRKIKGIEAILLRIFEWHDLHLQPPRGIIPLLDGLTQIAAMVVRVFRRHNLGLGIAKVLDPLLRLEVIFDPDPFAPGIDPHKGVAAIAVHMAVALGRPPVGHQNCHLVHRLR